MLGGAGAAGRAMRPRLLAHLETDLGKKSASRFYAVWGAQALICPLSPP